MLMKIGELARHTALTVRTLHHYHEIGLLTPSVRSDAGYRLYGRDDVARLHKIQALKQFGFSLSDIGTLLTSDGTTLPAIIAQQLQSLEQQMARAQRLCQQLQTLQAQLNRGDEPALADWLTTLELMTMYDKYFTPAELAELEQNKAQAKDDLEHRWPQMVARVRQLMTDGVPAEDPNAQALAREWMEMTQKLIGGNANLLIKLDTMTRQEQSIQQQSGIDPALLAYLAAARNALQNGIFANYLTPEQLQVVARQREQHGMAWPPLIAAVGDAMKEGKSLNDPAVQALARRWQAQGSAMAAGDPEIQAGLRRAYQHEPALMQASIMGQDLVTFIRAAIEQLPGEDAATT